MFLRRKHIFQFVITYFMNNSKAVIVGCWLIYIQIDSQNIKTFLLTTSFNYLKPVWKQFMNAGIFIADDIILS